VDKPQTFRSPTALVVWVVWLLFAVGNWIDLAVQGRDHVSAIAAALLLLGTGAAYVTAQRPRIIADDAGVTIRNPLRDHRVGWAGVAKVDLVDLLRVHCDGGTTRKKPKVISAWAVHYSWRRQFAAEARARRAAGPRRSGLGLPSDGRGLSYGAAPPTPADSAEAEAEKVVRVLSERATAARAEAVWASGTVPIAGPIAGATAESRTKAEAGVKAETVPAADTGADGTAAVAAAGWTEPLTSTWSARAIAALVIPALIVLLVWLL